MSNTYKLLTPSEQLGLLRSPGVQKRLWDKVRITDECWYWTGAVTVQGYGRFRVMDTLLSPYRVVFELTYGAIEPGVDIDHMCFTPACVNPEHLRPTTRKQNMEHLRGPNKRSTSGIRNVSWVKARNKWHVCVGHNGKNFHGGSYANLVDAEVAAKALRRELYTHDDYEHWTRATS